MAEKPKYAPDVATVLRESSKKALDEKLQRALDNPDLDRALDRVKPKLRPGEDPLFYDVDRRLSVTSVTPAEPSTAPRSPATAVGDSGTPAAEPQHAAEEQADAPGSPWERHDRDAELDPDALPSSYVPPAAPPTSVPIPSRSGRRFPFSPRLIALGVAFAILAPLTIALILSKTVQPKAGSPATPSSAAPSALPPSIATARLTATSVAPAEAATVAPTVGDGGASPMQPAPVPSAAPSPTQRAPIPVHRPAPSNEPHTPTPPPPATVAPALPPTVAPITPPPATSAKVPGDIY